MSPRSIDFNVTLWPKFVNSVVTVIIDTVNVHSLYRRSTSCLSRQRQPPRLPRRRVRSRRLHPTPNSVSPDQSRPGQTLRDAADALAGEPVNPDGFDRVAATSAPTARSRQATPSPRTRFDRPSVVQLPTTHVKKDFYRREMWHDCAQTGHASRRRDDTPEWREHP